MPVQTREDRRVLMPVYTRGGDRHVLTPVHTQGEDRHVLTPVHTRGDRHVLTPVHTRGGDRHVPMPMKTHSNTSKTLHNPQDHLSPQDTPILDKIPRFVTQ